MFFLYVNKQQSPGEWICISSEQASCEFGLLSFFKTEFWQFSAIWARREAARKRRDAMTLWTVACQAPLPMGLFRQEYWRGLPAVWWWRALIPSSLSGPLHEADWGSSQLGGRFPPEWVIQERTEAAMHFKTQPPKSHSVISASFWSLDVSHRVQPFEGRSVQEFANLFEGHQYYPFT